MAKPMSDSCRTPRLLQCFTLVLAIGIAASRDCKIDNSKDMLDPENVYQCPDDKTCCIEGIKPSCCGNQKMENEISDQTKIWGIVIGGAALIGILICCCRRDSDEGGKTCKYYVTCRWCCSKKHEDVEYQRFPPPSPTPSDQHKVPSLAKDLDKGQNKMATPRPDDTKTLATLQAEKLMEKLN